MATSHENPLTILGQHYNFWAPTCPVEEAYERTAMRKRQQRAREQNQALISLRNRFGTPTRQRVL